MARASSTPLPAVQAKQRNAPSASQLKPEALEDENARLKKLLAEAMLDVAALRAVRKNE